MDQDKIIKTYEQTGSLAGAAHKLAISANKVRKVLISAGCYESERTIQIADLAKAGKTVDEIAQELHISPSTVNNYLPYTKGIYNGDTPTLNARRIRSTRERKRGMKE